MEPRRFEDALELLRSEYLGAPMLSFTPGEVARILDIDTPTAGRLLQVLEEAHFLERTWDGRFTRPMPHH